MKLANIHLRKKENNYGSPDDKMLNYNFPQDTSNKKDKSSDKKSNRSKNNEFFREESLCITEENRYENQVNPIILADLGWSDDYKLDKLMV
jgi:hypothetical protein